MFVAFGGGVGYYLRQFSPVGPETFSFASNRDTDNRGSTSRPPLWLADARVLQKGNLPSWDCLRTGAGGDGSASASSQPAPLDHEECWVAPPLAGAAPGKIMQGHNTSK